MPLDFMFNYIGGDWIYNSQKKTMFAHFTDAEKEEAAQFVNKQLSIMDKQSPIPLTDYFSQSTLPQYTNPSWRSMVSNSSYWTERGRVTWEDMKVGDVVAWACPSCGWNREIWFIKILDKGFRDEKSQKGLIYRFGYAFLSKKKFRGETISELGYHRSGPNRTVWQDIFVKVVVNRNWQRPSSSNLYGSTKGMWRKISAGGGFINWVNATPFSEKP